MVRLVPFPIPGLPEQSAPPNAPIYQTDQSVRQHVTTVKTITSLSDLDEADKALFSKADSATHVLETKQTVFHPQGGGQPSDKGTMQSVASDGVSVFDVIVARHSVSSPGTILHAGSFDSDPPGTGHFQSGQQVHQEIDSATRDIHSRLHTAGHLIGFAVHALREQIGQVGEGKASHYPDAAFVEFIGLIAGEHKAAIQQKVDEYVRQNLDVGVEFVNEEQAKARCTAVPDVIKADADGWVRVVAVKGLGAYPCGGTHLPTTKEVGQVEVRHIRRKKDITKITYSVS